MKLLQSCIIAFAMYSQIPMPKTDWNKENMKYAMCFFPLVGLVLGLILMGAAELMRFFQASPLFFSIIMTLVPIAVTGGIHMDGFMDTSDALGSYGDREKKLEILKDPHTGAFAVIGVVCYLLLSVAVWSEAGETVVLPAAAGFVLSRALSGYAVAGFQPAKDSGLASTFHNASHKKVVKLSMVFYILVTIAILIWYEPWMAAAEILCAGAAFLLHRYNCSRIFGGITGDLAGYFLQVCELLILAGVTFTGHFIL